MGSSQKTDIEAGGLPKYRELGQFADLRGAWQERRELVFLRGLIPQCTLWSSIHSSLFSVLILHHKSCLSHVNIILCHYGGQSKTAVEQEAGEKLPF